MKTAALLALLAFAPIARAEPDLHVRPAQVVLPSHVSTVTSSDPEISARAQRIDERRTSSIGIGIGSAIAGGALSAIGALSDGSCSTPYGGTQVCEPNYKLIGVGAAVGLVGVIVAIARSPTAADYNEIASAWNARHPEQPIAVRD